MDDLIQGGCEHTPKDIEDSASNFWICVLFALIVVCASSHAQAVRIRAERIEDGHLITSHGTAWVYKKDKLVTCLHVVEKGTDVFCETEDGWIRCAVVKENKTDDLALLRPRIKLSTHGDPDGLWCWGSQDGQPIVQMLATVNAPVANIDGCSHGCSGGPIMRDGKLVGIVFALLGDLTFFTSAEKVMRFLK